MIRSIVLFLYMLRYMQAINFQWCEPVNIVRCTTVHHIIGVTVVL
jgi:hypothetical protein